MQKCHVTGIVSDAAGNALSGATIRFTLTKREKDGTIVIMPSPVGVKLGQDGALAVDLWPNSRGNAGTIYVVTVDTPNEKGGYTTYPSWKALVPDQETAVLNDISELVPPDSTDDVLAAVIEAREARDAAQTYRDDTKALHDEVMPLAGAVAVVSENVDAIQDAAALLAGGYTASTIPSASLAVIKMLDTATFPVAHRNDPGVEGFYQWDAAVPADMARADRDGITYISPDLSAAGAYVRVNLSAAERNAINRALNVRPFEAPPGVIDHFNSLMPAAPNYGRQINWCSNSENIADSHFSKDSVSLVSGDTMTWQGITLQRVTGFAFFQSRIRDLRAADYALVSGRRYIMSAVVCSPFIEIDNSGLPGPWNRFCWMNSPANSSTWGSGAKLIGPTPRRIWTVFEASGNSYKTVDGGDPALGLSGQTAATDRACPFFNGYGLGGSLTAKDIYIGGMQIEEAPDQAEKPGITVLGTSIDVGGGGGGKGMMTTQGRGWPRWFEGLLGVPIFDASIGGQNSNSILGRFDTDVASLAASSKYIVLCHNVNDFSSGFDSASYRSNWEAIRQKAIAAGFDRVIHMTPQRRSSYNYANGAADMEAEIAYIKATYPFVIDRDDVMQDCFNADLLNPVYNTSGDGIHQSTSGNRTFAFMLYHKYRHFFSFNNMPGAYQKTVNDDQKVQSFGSPAWLNRLSAARITSTGTTAVRDTDTGTAPYLIFEAALSGAVTYQLPCANYQRPGERTNTDVQVQKVLNLTGQNISIQYYKRDVANTVSPVGSAIGPIPNGQCWTVATDGVTAWREQ